MFALPCMCIYICTYIYIYNASQLPPPCLNFVGGRWKSESQHQGRGSPTRRHQGSSNGAKIGSAAIWEGYVLFNMASGRFVTQLGRSCNAILTASGASKDVVRRPTPITNRFWLWLRIGNVNLLIFHTPPFEKHCFWIPWEAKMEPQ